MIFGVLIILLFLLGFGFMIFSHAHREIHPLNRKLGSFISIFIIASTIMMVVYLGGYLFYVGLFEGEDAFKAGMSPFDQDLAMYKSGSAKTVSLEKSLTDLNTYLQKQAVRQAKSLSLEKELKAFKAELKSLKSIVSKQRKRTSATQVTRRVGSRYVRRPTRKAATTTTAKATSSPKVIKDLVGYDPSKYTAQTEPLLYIPID